MERSYQTANKTLTNDSLIRYCKLQYYNSAAVVIQQRQDMEDQSMEKNRREHVYQRKNNEFHFFLKYFFTSEDFLHKTLAH